MRSNLLKLIALLLMAILTGCAAQPYDYTAYRQVRPRSILILPPVNNSPDVTASYSVLSHMTLPLAESGYYVFPVALVDETFKQNGLNSPADIHAVAPAKLQKIFGADAALYVTVTEYGTKFMVVSSATVVTASAKLVDLKTGQLLWEGSATASNQENQQAGGGGLAGIVLSAVVNQVVSNLTNESHKIAGMTSQRLLFARKPNGILYGPRSPKYQSD